MHPNQVALENFYTAFARLDADTMAACYAPDAQFNDPVFSLSGHRDVTGMWRMLCAGVKARGADVWKLRFSGIEADAIHGYSHWEADYRFSATGRMVHNVIDGTFDFNEQGLITNHKDSFSFPLWARQALGMPGLVLGWTPYLHNKVRAQAAGNLKKFLAAHR
jgi:hypothetical protein